MRPCLALRSKPRLSFAGSFINRGPLAQRRGDKRLGNRAPLLNFFGGVDHHFHFTREVCQGHVQRYRSAITRFQVVLSLPGCQVVLGAGVMRSSAGNRRSPLGLFPRQPTLLLPMLFGGKAPARMEGD